MTTTCHIHADGQVLAAIDDSTYTDSVCRHGAWAAARLGAPLEFVHVIDRIGQPAITAPIDLSGNLVLGEKEALLAELSALDEKRGRVAQQRGRLLLQQACRTAASGGLDDAETRLRHGGLVDTLVALESGVRLFVVGKRGEHADFAKGHLGSEVERVVRAVHRPLLVASREFRPVRRVLIAFDGSATTRKGVEMVAESPLFRGLEVDVLTVGDGNAAQGLDWATATLAQAGFAAVAHRVEGDPEEAIAAHVRDNAIGLLVMGAYGHSRIRQLIVGSTTTAVLRNCQIPVLLLR